MNYKKADNRSPIDKAIHYLTQQKIKMTKENFVKKVVEFGGDADKARNYFDNYCITPSKMF